MKSKKKFEPVTKTAIDLAFLVLALIGIGFMVAGCSTIEDRTGAAPYFDVGAGYLVNTNSDWFVRTDREWQCSRQPMAQFAVGLDWGATELEYEHQSWWFCGGPKPIGDGSPELYQDSINLTHRFGGK